MAVGVAVAPDRFRQSSYGFTLLEILIAVALFAALFMAAQQMFNTAMNNSERLDEEASALENQQRLLTWLTTDLEQVVMRPVRDSLGDPLPAVLGADRRLAFTRAGWANPFSLRHRSELQRVEYFLEDGELIRRYYPYLDAVAGVEPVDTVMLDGVEAFQARYLFQDANTGEYRWLDRWPDANMTATPVLLQPLPVSIEVDIRLEDGQVFHRFFRTVANPWL